MAEEDEKTTVEMDDTGAAGEKKGPNILFLGGIGVGAIVIGVVLALFVLRPMMSGSDDEADHDESAGIEQAEKGSGKKESSHGTEKKPARKKKPKKSGHGGEEEEGSLVYAIQDIVVNPAGTAGSRFLSISFGFDVGSDELWADFEDREQMVRDALITILSSKTVSQLTDAKQKEIMRYQIKKRLSKLLETEDLEAVYYTDFVLQ